LIAGNAAEGEGAKALWVAGADITKCNVGGGSICLTREKTGNGVPSLSALSSARDVKYGLEKRLGRKLFLMNDGGMKTPGCVSKALCFADLCMSGNLFSSCNEAPGDFIVKGERKYKSYVGSSTHKNGTYLEGVEAMTEAKGSVVDIIRQLGDGIRSCCSYQGVKNLVDLKSDPRFVRITGAGLQESGAHDVIVLHK
jgi:IMP dehydrogenase